MSYSRNADDFGIKVEQIQAAAKARRTSLTLAGKAPSPELDVVARESWAKSQAEQVEARVRDVLLDGLLGALNWQKMPDANGAPEAAANLDIEVSVDPLQSDEEPESDEKRKRLDYFGYECDTERPLLVLEAKRGSTRLPAERTSTSEPDRHPTGTAVSVYLDATRAEIPSSYGQLLVGWQKILNQARGYARGVFGRSGLWPKCVAISNGTWLVVITDPEASFSRSGVKREQAIWVFESMSEVAVHAGIVWRAMSYDSLADKAPSYRPVDLPFIIKPSCIRGVMFGLRIVRGGARTTKFERRPSLSVSPALVLRADGVGYLRVFDPTWEQEIPDSEEAIRDHIEAVAVKANALKVEVERCLNVGILPITPIEKHFEDATAFACLRAVTPIELSKVDDRDQAAFALTGAECHILVDRPEYSGCPHHQYMKAAVVGKAHLAGPVLFRTDDQASAYFTEGSAYHCADADIFRIKQHEVDAANRDRCGSRSTRDGGAFCELWRLEQMLCCHKCVYQRVCCKSLVFKVPCSGLVHVTVSGAPGPT